MTPTDSSTHPSRLLHMAASDATACAARLAAGAGRQAPCPGAAGAWPGRAQRPLCRAGAAAQRLGRCGPMTSTATACRAAPGRPDQRYALARRSGGGAGRHACRHAQASALVLLGHSLRTGGSRFCRFGPAPCGRAGAVLSGAGPASVGVQKALVASLPRLLPNLRVANGVQSAHLSHDPEVALAYDADAAAPAHQRPAGAIWPRAAAMCCPRRRPGACPRCCCGRARTSWSTRPAAPLLPPRHRDLVQSQCFETAYHEIFNRALNLPRRYLRGSSSGWTSAFPRLEDHSRGGGCLRPFSTGLARSFSAG
jgi:hypothetical protein